MNIRDWYHRLDPPEEGSVLTCRTGRFLLSDLPEIVEQGKIRRVMVSTENFGLVRCDKAQVLRTLADDYFQQRAERVEKSKGGRVEVSVSMDRVREVKHEAYDLSIHTIGIWDGDSIWVAN